MALQNLRSVSIDFNGVEAVLAESAALEEGTVVTQFNTLTGEVLTIIKLHPVVLPVLTDTDKHIITEVSIKLKKIIQSRLKISEVRSLTLDSMDCIL